MFLPSFSITKTLHLVCLLHILKSWEFPPLGAQLTLHFQLPGTPTMLLHFPEQAFTHSDLDQLLTGTVTTSTDPAPAAAAQE